MKHYKVLLTASLAIFLLWALTASSVFLPFSLQDKGAFGDLFGSLNALFSGLAFAGLIYTIYLQRQELELQRTELRENREELARAATAHERNLRLSNLNAMIQAYSVILNPQAGIKDREFKRGKVDAETIKNQLFDALSELDALSKEK